MAITAVSGLKDTFEKDIVIPSRKHRFTIKQLDEQIARLQAQIDALKKDKADATAITTEVVNG